MEGSLPFPGRGDSSAHRKEGAMADKDKKVTPKVKIRDLKPQKVVKGGRMVKSSDPCEGGE